MTMDATTRRISFKTPERVRTRADVFPIWQIISRKTVKYADVTYQEHNSYVQSKSNRCIGNEVPGSDAPDILHGHLGDFKEESSDTVHDETRGSKVVERHERVHLELGRAEKSLDHDETDRLEDSSKDLVYHGVLEGSTSLPMA